MQEAIATTTESSSSSLNPVFALLTQHVSSFDISTKKNVTFYSWGSHKEEVAQRSPFLQTHRDPFKKEVKPQFSQAQNFVDLHCGQILNGHGAEVCGFMSHYFDIPVFSVLEQGRGTARMIVRTDDVPILQLNVAKRSGMHYDGEKREEHEIPIHMLCLDDGLYICKGESIEDVKAKKHSRYRAVILPNSTCDVSFAHNTTKRLQLRRDKRATQRTPPAQLSPNDTTNSNNASITVVEGSDSSNGSSTPPPYAPLPPAMMGRGNTTTNHAAAAMLQATGGVRIPFPMDQQNFTNHPSVVVGGVPHFMVPHHAVFQNQQQQQQLGDSRLSAKAMPWNPTQAVTVPQRVPKFTAVPEPLLKASPPKSEADEDGIWTSTAADGGMNQGSSWDEKDLFRLLNETGVKSPVEVN